MANSSALTGEMKEVDLPDSSEMGGPSDSEYVPAQGAAERERATTSSAPFSSASTANPTEKRTGTIVERDLKASNVLVNKDRVYGQWMCFVAYFECSIGVVGTGFWRAPEILQACKEKNVSQRPELFTKQADIYSYGMTCYEILTGKLPLKVIRSMTLILSSMGNGQICRSMLMIGHVNF